MTDSQGKPFVSVVILAAGLSTRFGRNKLLEEVWEGTTIIQHVVSEAVGSKCREVIVVCGHDSERVRKTLGAFRCKLVLNENYVLGQSSSVKKGVSAVDARADALMVLPGDVALMTSGIINAVVDEYASTRLPIVAAGYNGRAGHPILFDRSLFGELSTIDEEGMGLKKVISRHKGDIGIVETSIASLLDIDTQEDLRRLEAAKREQS